MHPNLLIKIEKFGGEKRNEIEFWKNALGNNLYRMEIEMQFLCSDNELKLKIFQKRSVVSTFILRNRNSTQNILDR